MTYSPMELAARVVAEVEPTGRAADAVLRESLRAARRQDTEQAREVSELVFGYFRWRGWLDRSQPLPRQLVHSRELAGRFAREEAAVDDAALARAVPDWVWSEMEVSQAWLRALQRPPRLWLRARPGQGSRLARELGDCRASTLPGLADALEYHGRTDLFRTPAFHAGRFEVQDLASQMVGVICDPKPGETWWDVCAGEGGKTLHLSDLMGNTGLIWATDRAPWRLQRLRRRAARAQCFNYRVRVWDGGGKLPMKTSFDGVLVDAPCSGVGTWGRNPHARWTTTPRDVRELAAVQERLLALAARAVKPGGRLVYAVCTLTRAETQEVVRAFSAAHPAFAPLPLPSDWPIALFAAGAEPGGCLWPQATGGNGMFVAAWRCRGNAPLTGGAPAS